MEIVYGIVLLMVFIIGISIGLVIPFFIKLYTKKLLEENVEMKEEKNVQSLPIASSLTKEVLDEWQNGI